MMRLHEIRDEGSDGKLFNITSDKIYIHMTLDN